MDEGTRFLILSLEGESYAIPIARLLEITVARNIQREPSLTELFEGKVEFRGARIPVLNVKKIFKLPSPPGSTMLVIKSRRGTLGILVDAVTDILDTEQKPAPLPKGVLDPGLQCYNGILRHKEKLVLLLNQDELLP